MRKFIWRVCVRPVEVTLYMNIRTSSECTARWRGTWDCAFLICLSDCNAGTSCTKEWSFQFQQEESNTEIVCMCVHSQWCSSVGMLKENITVNHSSYVPQLKAIAHCMALMVWFEVSVCPRTLLEPTLLVWMSMNCMFINSNSNWNKWIHCQLSTVSYCLIERFIMPCRVDKHCLIPNDDGWVWGEKQIQHCYFPLKCPVNGTKSYVNNNVFF